MIEHLSNLIKFIKPKRQIGQSSQSEVLIINESDQFAPDVWSAVLHFEEKKNFFENELSMISEKMQNPTTLTTEI